MILPALMPAARPPALPVMSKLQTPTRMPALQAGKPAPHSWLASELGALGCRFHHRPAAFERLSINQPALRARVGSIAPVIMFQPLPHYIRSGVGDGALGNQPAAQGNLAHQLARQRPPSERSPHNRKDGALLAAEAGIPPARRGDQKRHADLVACQKRRVGGEFPERPRQLHQARDHVGQRRRYREQRVLPRNGMDGPFYHRPPEDRVLAPERQPQILVAVQNRADGGRGVAAVKRIGSRRRRDSLLEQNQVHFIGNHRVGRPVYLVQQIGAVFERPLGRRQEIFHLRICRVARRHQAETHRATRAAAHFLRIQQREGGARLFPYLHHMRITEAARRPGGETSLAAPYAILPPARLAPHRWRANSTARWFPTTDETPGTATPAGCAAAPAAARSPENIRTPQTLRGPGAISRGSNSPAPAAAGADRPTPSIPPPRGAPRGPPPAGRGCRDRRPRMRAPARRPAGGADRRPGFRSPRARVLRAALRDTRARAAAAVPAPCRARGAYPGCRDRAGPQSQ